MAESSTTRACMSVEPPTSAVVNNEQPSIQPPLTSMLMLTIIRLRGCLRGLAIGRPVYSEVPFEVSANRGGGFRVPNPWGCPTSRAFREVGSHTADTRVVLALRGRRPDHLEHFPLVHFHRPSFAKG